MMRANPSGHRPTVASDAFVDPAAILIGDVRIGPGSFVAPTAVIRADEADEGGAVGPVVIRGRCNVQDGVIVHALKGTGVCVGDRSSLSHGALVHGPAEIGTDCFIGFRAIVFSATLGDGVFVGAGAIVQDVRLAANVMVRPGQVVTRQLQADGLERTGEKEIAFMRAVIAANARLAAGYAITPTPARSIM